MAKKKSDYSSSFFENVSCKCYPCHKGMDEINCLMCFCPLFSECENKDNGNGCPECTFVHKKDMYPFVMQKLQDAYENKKDGKRHESGSQQEQMCQTDNCSDSS